MKRVNTSAPINATLAALGMVPVEFMFPDSDPAESYQTRLTALVDKLERIQGPAETLEELIQMGSWDLYFKAMRLDHIYPLLRAAKLAWHKAPPAHESCLNTLKTTCESIACAAAQGIFHDGTPLTLRRLLDDVKRLK